MASRSSSKYVIRSSSTAQIQQNLATKFVRLTFSGVDVVVVVIARHASHPPEHQRGYIWYLALSLSDCAIHGMQ